MKSLPMMPADESNLIAESAMTTTTASPNLEIIANALNVINCLPVSEGGLYHNNSSTYSSTHSTTHSTTYSSTYSTTYSSLFVSEKCPVIWDSLLCWNEVPAGYVAKVACSQVFQVMGVPTPEDNQHFQGLFSVKKLRLTIRQTSYHFDWHHFEDCDLTFAFCAQLSIDRCICNSSLCFQRLLGHRKLDKLYSMFTFLGIKCE